MFTNIMIVGRMGDKIDDVTRYIEVDHLNEQSIQLETDKMPVRYWTKTAGCPLMKFKSGSIVALRGRITSDKDLGLVVIAEVASVMFNGKYQVM